MTKIRNFSKQNVFLFTLAVCLITCLFLTFPATLFNMFPHTMLRDYIREIFDMLWPVALSLLFGFRFIYNRKGFGSTLLISLPLLLLFTAMLIILILDIHYKGVQWETGPAILLGILHVIGIGVREEIIYRGIIGNAMVLKYAKDKKGLWFSVIVSGLVFGFIHITNIFHGVELPGLIAQMTSAVAAGLLFMAIYLRGGNLWVLMFVHAVIDSAGMFESSFTVTTVTAVDQVSGLNPVGAVINIFAYTCIVLFLLRKSKHPAIFARLEQLRAGRS